MCSWVSKTYKKFFGSENARQIVQMIIASCFFPHTGLTKGFIGILYFHIGKPVSNSEFNRFGMKSMHNNMLKNIQNVYYGYTSS